MEKETLGGMTRMGVVVYREEPKDGKIKIKVEDVEDTISVELYCKLVMSKEDCQQAIRIMKRDIKNLKEQIYSQRITKEDTYESVERLYEMSKEMEYKVDCLNWMIKIGY